MTGEQLGGANEQIWKDYGGLITIVIGTPIGIAVFWVVHRQVGIIMAYLAVILTAVVIMVAGIGVTQAFKKYSGGES